MTHKLVAELRAKGFTVEANKLSGILKKADDNGKEYYNEFVEWLSENYETEGGKPYTEEDLAELDRETAKEIAHDYVDRVSTKHDAMVILNYLLGNLNGEIRDYMSDACSEETFSQKQITYYLTEMGINNPRWIPDELGNFNASSWDEVLDACGDAGLNVIEVAQAYCKSHGMEPKEFQDYFKAKYRGMTSTQVDHADGAGTFSKLDDLFKHDAIDMLDMEYTNNDRESNENYIQLDGPEDIHEELEHMGDAEYHHLLPVLYALHHHKLPITSKELEQKEGALNKSMSKLPEFKQFFGSSQAKNKPITKEFLHELEEGLTKVGYKVNYGRWDSSLQRSTKHVEQLVLNVCASPEHIRKMEELGVYEKFKEMSSAKDGSHPYADNQIGWIRMSVAEDKSYVLIDEIQTDIVRTNEEEAADEKTKEIFNLFRDFNHVAMIMAQQFARHNGIKKIFYHTYDGGKKLKHNHPPVYLYSDVPKNHFYKTTEEKPFDLSASFFMKHARLLLKAAKYLTN